MHDINVIRQQPDWFKDQIKKLNDPGALQRIDTVLDLDQKRRTMLTESEAIQAERNRLNKAVGRLRGDRQLDEQTKTVRAAAAAEALRAGNYVDAVAIISGEQASPSESVELDMGEAFDALTDALRDVGDRVNTINEELRPIEQELEEHMLWLPNLPHESVPVADSDEANVPWQPEGQLPEFDFEPKAHWDLGPALGIIDFERGVKLAGSRAYVLRGWGARLQRALEMLFLDMAREKGFEEVYVPFYVNREMLVGAGQFPKFTDVVYYDADADVYMLPTAEVAITNLFRDEILDEDDLPMYFVADTPCFRRERAAAGRDTRGIKRVHQFQKVEMYKFTHPDTSYEELEALTEAAADVCRRLKLPFRRLEIVTGDLGFSATKKYDIEVWAAGSEEWLEVSSCSNTEAFQARRANVRFRPKDKKKPEFVHTLNGSGLALPRVIAALIENNQQADGSVLVPEALRPYLGADVIRGRDDS
ncbi:MAG: serine--tRNA ligase [Chloroflexota bacterium]